jgi:hypothetical protein
MDAEGEGVEPKDRRTCSKKGCLRDGLLFDELAFNSIARRYLEGAVPVL